MNTVHRHFQKIAMKTVERVGSPLAFATALGIVLLWLAVGPIFHFSDTWQLFINTGTTIITFLMVFLIQYAQNRDTQTIHLKLNELLIAKKNARNELVDLEEMSDEAIQSLREEFRRIHEQLQEEASDRGLKNGRSASQRETGSSSTTTAR